MPKFSVVKSIKINKPASDVRETIINFQTWPSWSPWLIMEPKCRVTYGGESGQVGSSYQWFGEMVGSGEMAITSLSENKMVCDLNFLKPYKSYALVTFEISELNDATELTWTLDSSLPWFMFWMTNQMSQLIGMDYERGLKMLKSLVETGTVASKLEMLGEHTESSLWYVGLECRGKTSELGALMGQDFTKLADYFEQEKLHATGKPFSLYFDMDMATSDCHLHNCLPVAQKLEVKPPFVCQALPTKETFLVKHTGEYQFMGNAWSFAMMATRHLKVKIRKSPVGLERYLNDPSDTPSERLESEVALLRR